MSRSRWFYGFVVAVCAFSAVAQDDAGAYAAAFGMDADEAALRLVLQRQAGDLDAVLAATEKESFAGLYIQHEPEFRVIVQFTDRGAEERLKSRVAGTPLAGLVEARRVRFSLEDLEKRRETTRAQSRAAGVAFNSDIDVVANRAELHVIEADKLQARLAAAGARVPEGVMVKRVSRLAQPETTIRGGVALSTCTAGFTVRNNTTGELGVSTAAHCGNTQYYQGVSLPFRLEDNNTDQDVQWHSACDLFDVTNEIEIGSGAVRTITGTMPRNNQAVGSVVCKYGMTTGYTCGTISSKTFDLGANHNATFVRVNNYPSANLSEAGDSGGPWFVEGYAYGTHFGAPGDDANDSIYMAINYISSLGVSVLTSSPGSCNRRPTANFTWTVNGNYVDFDASGSSDPDGTIVRYDWDFGDGTTISTTSPYTYQYYPTQSTYSVEVTVVDNEGAIASRRQLISLCGTRFCVE